MICRKEISPTNGTSQNNRQSEALDPAFAKLDSRNLRELLSYLRKLAQYIHYYNADNPETPYGDWTELFRPLLNEQQTELVSLPALQQLAGDYESQDPALQMILLFLQEYEQVQQAVNSLSKKHLDHYFFRELGFEKKPAIPDKVLVSFELAKNQESYHLAQGTILSAGKDEDGNPVTYRTLRDTIVNHARVANIISLYVDKEDNHKLYWQQVDLENEEGWYPFGSLQRGLSASQRTMQQVQMGFAITSRLLDTPAGERKVTITLHQVTLADPGESSSGNIAGLFSAAISTTDGWQAVPIDSFNLAGDQLIIRLTIAEDLTVAAAPQHKQPVIKFLYRTSHGEFQLLRGLTFQDVSLQVNVSNALAFELSNDFATLNPEKAFQPLGPQPMIGSAFQLRPMDLPFPYLTQIAFSIEWQDLPDFKEHYQSYTANTNNRADISNSSFKARVRIGDQVITDSVNLFTSALSISGNSKLPALADDPLEIALVAPRIDNPSFTAFGHKEFARYYAERAILKIGDATITLPNPPFTPQAKSITMRYTAEAQLSSGAGEFSHWYPMGHQPLSVKTRQKLLPQFPNRGYLYLGIEKADIPGTLSLQVHTQQGTSRADQLLQSEDINWDVLAGNQWQNLNRASLPVDTTEALQSNGILQLAVPEAAAESHSQWPADLLWLRATVEEKTTACNQWLHLQAQAVDAEYVMPANKPNAVQKHLDRELAPQQIEQLQRRVPAIKKVHQPYPSYGGRQEERDPQLYVRSSERLRHKQRAITPWDYERLVLEAFPEIYMVKCLPGYKDGKQQAGAVTLVVIADHRQKYISRPLAPAVNLLTLRQVEEYISQHTSPFVEVQAVNPLFEQLSIHCQVAFYPQYDQGFYQEQLNQELVKYLSPWTFGREAEIDFEARIYRTGIIHFLETREYVDFVTHCHLYHRHNSGPLGGIGCMEISDDFIIHPPSEYDGIGQLAIADDFIVGKPVEEALATTPASVLVSGPRHHIDLVKPGDYQCPTTYYDGIGYMAVGINFKVHEEDYLIN